MFLPWSSSAVESIDQSLKAAGWLLMQSIPPSCADLCEVVEVRGYAKEGEIDLNIIYLDPDFACDPLSIASRNDFGICQISAWLEGGEWRFDYTEAFIDDVTNKTFTLTREGDEARSLRRYTRLREKYPEHALLTPLMPSLKDTFFPI